MSSPPRPGVMSFSLQVSASRFGRGLSECLTGVEERTAKMKLSSARFSTSLSHGAATALEIFGGFHIWQRVRQKFLVHGTTVYFGEGHALGASFQKLLWIDKNADGVGSKCI